MAAWMKTWGSIAPAGEKLTRSTSPQSQSSVDVRADIVMVLASMALSCTKEKEGDG
jgi:hypothetical protein